VLDAAISTAAGLRHVLEPTLTGSAAHIGNGDTAVKAIEESRSQRDERAG
jgi:hypothetical protein